MIEEFIKNLREKYTGEDSLDEKRGRKRHRKKAAKKKKHDRCARIAKRKYDVWPSAYASGAAERCRAGKIWKGLSEDMTDEQLAENQEYEQLEEDRPYISDEEARINPKDIVENLRRWYGRQGAPGKTGGWIDCNTCRKDKKTGRKKCKPCGRKKVKKEQSILDADQPLRHVQRKRRKRRRLRQSKRLSTTTLELVTQLMTMVPQLISYLSFGMM